MNAKINSFSVSFTVKKAKASEGQAPVYCIITYNGKRTETSLKRRVPILQWRGHKLTGNSADVRQFNMYMDKLRLNAHRTYEALMVDKELITAEIIKNSVFNLEVEDAPKTLLDLSAYHFITEKEKLAWGTMRHYRVTENYFKRFLKCRHQRKDIPVKKIDYKFLLDFENFLRNWKPDDHQRPPQNNGVMKHMIRFRKMMNLAKKLEWIEVNPFNKYKTKMLKSEREYLTAEELSLIETKELPIERIAVVRDIFVFSCYTGLAYSEVYNLKEEHIRKGVDGGLWIFFKRGKNDNPFSVPLLPKALAVIQKYQQHPKAQLLGQLLPISSNQKTNTYLKEIAIICGIKKQLTFHIARHTFATTVTLTNGVPIESVSKMLGHSKIATTQIYAKVIETKLSQDMKALRNVLDEKHKLEAH